MAVTSVGRFERFRKWRLGRKGAMREVRHGAVVGLRNPRAHKLIQDDAERALEFIAFVSLLARL
jgi:hypothetical protein